MKVLDCVGLENNKGIDAFSWLNTDCLILSEWITSLFSIVVISSYVRTDVVNPQGPRGG